MKSPSKSNYQQQKMRRKHTRTISLSLLASLYLIAPLRRTSRKVRVGRKVSFKSSIALLPVGRLVLLILLGSSQLLPQLIIEETLRVSMKKRYQQPLRRKTMSKNMMMTSRMLRVPLELVGRNPKTMRFRGHSVRVDSHPWHPAKLRRSFRS
jgi:hypothetical protein